MPITQYTGKTLLSEDTILAIQKQADLIVQNKDVALAWQASQHLKAQISSLPEQEIKPVLDKYRAITTKLKALALPLLEKEDIEHLLRNNLEFLDTQAEQLLLQGLKAWIASQEDESQEQIKKKLSAIIPKDHSLSEQILKILQTARHPEQDAAGSEVKDLVNNAQVSSTRSFVRPGRTQDDMVDLTKAAKKADQIKTAPSSDETAEQIARQIYAQSGSSRSEQDFVRRAQALVKSRLRDVRTKVDIKEYLSRTFEVGGLGLTAEAIESAQNMIETAYNRVHVSQVSLRGSDSDRGNLRISKNLPEISVSAAARPGRAKEGQNNQKTTQNRMVSGKSTDLPIDSPDKLISNIADLKDLSSVSVDNTKKVVDPGRVELPRHGLSSESGKPAGPTTKSIIPQNRGQDEIDKLIKTDENPNIIRKPIQSGKVRVDDIKTQAQPRAPQKSTTSSGEFASFSISDLRAQADAKQATEKILSKMRTMEQESIAHKMSAIRSFRQSPLYGQYIAIGEASLIQGKKLSQALADLSVNPDKITEAEFFAISDLNSKLR